MISRTLPTRRYFTRFLFGSLAILCFLPFVTPPIALALGLLYGWLVNTEPSALHRTSARLLLQASVVGLGFGIDLQNLLHVSITGLGFTIAVIAIALGFGTWLGSRFRLSRRAAHLISSGTAICGGSAIAAIGPVVDADEREMSVALGTVFLLNAVALFLFPVIGELLAMTPMQFGVWSAIAIHDTSSVVGAASRFGAEALTIATTVKLARTLWLIPLLFATAYVFHTKTCSFSIPYFILFFVGASILRTVVPPLAQHSPVVLSIARTGLEVTLFLIGSTLTRNLVRSIGVRPFGHGVILWLVIAVSTLLVILMLL